MNILFLEGDMSRHGGTERMTAFLANRLATRHAVTVISFHFCDTNIFFPLDKNVEHLTLSARNLFCKIREISHIVKEKEVDVVINVDTGMGYIGILAAFGTNARVITWEHSNFYNNWDSRIFPYMRQFAARYSHAMVVLTERDKQNYIANIRKCSPVITIANPSEKLEHLYDATSNVILSVGQLVQKKRFDLLIPIGKIVFERHPDWKWCLCGDGPERRTLEAMVEQASLSENIYFLGAVKDMESLYRTSAMCVLTSEMEGLPMVLLEAKAYGLPIVSFDIQTGPSDIVRDGENGYLVEWSNTTGMAEKICQLIEDAELRCRFSENAVLDMEKFDEERILEQWEQLIISLCKMR